MFDFMRKKKEKAEPAKVGKAEHEGEKNKHGLRRNSLVQTGRMEMFTKRARYFSAPAAFQNDESEALHPSYSSSDSKTDRKTEASRIYESKQSPVIRPEYPRAPSSVASSLDIRNPFRQHTGDSAMTASQVALTESTPSFSLPVEHMQYVVSHTPIVISPQAESADIFFADGVDLERDPSLVSNPFVDEHSPTINIMVEEGHVTTSEMENMVDDSEVSVFE
ncbi:hypothetical protein AcV5_005934 [Taiwanofungus camphoratus]|nr:hypothetical protein AcW2_004375 [Antrodia cinnamomea]KAI0933920.1 hypothetical protein AcV5_005934 [Antrodia cinnamomea]KAI0948286.1 hypothetical protein AcV7_009082 [Antrodia cinnamomea]